MLKCEICDSTDFKVTATEIREGLGRISQCKSCDLVVQDKKYTTKELDQYYNKDYVVTNSLDLKRKLSVQEHFNSRIETIQPLVERVRKFLKPNMRVLELGCGAGELLYSIKRDVASVAGIELNKEFTDFINDKLSIKAYYGDINKIDFGDDKFDLIISIDTLDHLPNPLETLQTIKKLLSPDGIVFTEVPNLNEALNFYLPDENKKAYNKFFWHKAHLFYFSYETLTKIMNRAGFSCEISCNHKYTFHNFLNWYFKGSPQITSIDASTKIGLFSGDDEFAIGINEIFFGIEERFHQLMNRTFRGQALCCLTKPINLSTKLPCFKITK